MSPLETYRVYYRAVPGGAVMSAHSECITPMGAVIDVMTKARREHGAQARVVDVTAQKCQQVAP